MRQRHPYLLICIDKFNKVFLFHKHMRTHFYSFVWLFLHAHCSASWHYAHNIKLICFIQKRLTVNNQIYSLLSLSLFFSIQLLFQSGAICHSKASKYENQRSISTSHLDVPRRRQLCISFWRQHNSMAFLFLFWSTTKTCEIMNESLTVHWSKIVRKRSGLIANHS